MTRPPQLDDHHLALKMQIVAARERKATACRDRTIIGKSGQPPEVRDPLILKALSTPMSAQRLAVLIDISARSARTAVKRLEAAGLIRLTGEKTSEGRVWQRIGDGQ